MKILETKRLILRELEEGDLDELAAIYADIEVMRYIAKGEVFTREQTEKSIRGWRKYQQDKGYANWAVVDKLSGSLAGMCGFNELPDGTGIEIAYLFAKAWWGKGIGTEISSAALNYGFETLMLNRIFAFTYPQNKASIRIIDKLGMKFVKEAEFWGINFLMYSINKKNEK